MLPWPEAGPRAVREAPRVAPEGVVHGGRIDESGRVQAEVLDIEAHLSQYIFLSFICFT